MGRKPVLLREVRLFVAELRATGAMREDLSDDDAAADIVWSMNAAEYYVLLVNECGWTPKFGTHLADTWSRVLLASPYPAPCTGTR